MDKTDTRHGRHRRRHIGSGMFPARSPAAIPKDEEGQHYDCIEMQEHLRVVKTLEPLPADRRAFRLIGGVLVEKTVGEVLPAVQQQQEQLNQLILRLTDTITEKEKDLKKMQKEFDLQKREITGNQNQGGRSMPGILA